MRLRGNGPICSFIIQQHQQIIRLLLSFFAFVLRGIEQLSNEVLLNIYIVATFLRDSYLVHERMFWEIPDIIRMLDFFYCRVIIKMRTIHSLEC